MVEAQRGVGGTFPQLRGNRTRLLAPTTFDISSLWCSTLGVPCPSVCFPVEEHAASSASHAETMRCNVPTTLIVELQPLQATINHWTPH